MSLFTLPPRASLEHLKHQAKALHKAHRSGDHAVLRHAPGFDKAPDEEILRAGLSLQEVQHALARAYGSLGWKQLCDAIDARTAESAPGLSLDEVVSAFSEKGPDHDSTGSAWEQEWRAQLQQVLEAGEEGFSLMCRLARSDNGRLRAKAVLYFGLAADPRAEQKLTELLGDESPKVRLAALRWLADHLHPQGRTAAPWGWGLARPADRVPPALDAVIALIDDANPKIRRGVVCVLTAYARLAHPTVDAALDKALHDRSHAVHHVGAYALAIPCPKCGTIPQIPG